MGSHRMAPQDVGQCSVTLALHLTQLHQALLMLHDGARAGACIAAELDSPIMRLPTADPSSHGAMHCILAQWSAGF